MTHEPNTPELSRNSCLTRSRLGAPSRLLCLIALLGSAAACTGTIDNNEDRSSLRPVTNGGTNDGAGAGNATTPGAMGSNAAGETNPRDLSANQGGGAPRSSGGGSRGARSPRDDEDRADAGDEVEADAGVIEVDGGGIDAGGIDVDAGAGDASAAPL